MINPGRGRENVAGRHVFASGDAVVLAALRSEIITNPARFRERVTAVADAGRLLAGLPRSSGRQGAVPRPTFSAEVSRLGVGLDRARRWIKVGELGAAVLDRYLASLVGKGGEPSIAGLLRFGRPAAVRPVPTRWEAIQAAGDALLDAVDIGDPGLAREIEDDPAAADWISQTRRSLDAMFAELDSIAQDPPEVVGSP